MTIKTTTSVAATIIMIAQAEWQQDTLDTPRIAKTEDMAVAEAAELTLIITTLKTIRPIQIQTITEIIMNMKQRRLLSLPAK